MSYDYNNSPLDFNKAKEDVAIFVMDYVEETGNEQDSFMEYDAQNLCKRHYPSTTELSIWIFVGMLFQVLLVNGTQFSFRREGKRSRFLGIRLNRSDEDSYKAKNTYQRRIMLQGEDHTEPVVSLDDYVKFDAGKRVNIVKLRKVYMAAAPDGNGTLFHDSIRRLLDANEGLSLEEEGGSNGKTKRYLVGLRLNSKGQRLING